jgi:hypothetical protein
LRHRSCPAKYYHVFTCRFSGLVQCELSGGCLPTFNFPHRNFRPASPKSELCTSGPSLARSHRETLRDYPRGKARLGRRAVINQRIADNPARWHVGRTGQAGNIPALLQQSLATRPTPATVLRSAHSPFIFATDICNAPSPMFTGSSAMTQNLHLSGTVREIMSYPHGL